MIWIALVCIFMTMSLCLATYPVLWLIAVAISPLVLFAFWRKPTLKSMQTIFSVVYSLALGCISIFSASNAAYSAQFYTQVTKTQLFFIYFAVLFATSALASLTFAKFAKRPYAWFFLSVLCSVAYACIPQRSVVACAVCFALVVVSATGVLISIRIMSKKIDEASRILQKKNVAPFLLLRNLALVFAIAGIYVFAANNLFGEKALFVTNVCVNAVCALLMLVLTFTYLRQPMDAVAEAKLAALKRNSETLNADLTKRQLEQRLACTQNYPLAAFAKKIFLHILRCKMVGEEITDETACFVANHYEIYGPFACALHFPLPCCIWTEAAMTNEDKTARQIKKGIDNLTRKWLIAPIRKKIPKLVARPLTKCINFSRPIAVYRLNNEKIDKMFEDSVAALTTGDNVIVFPEKPPHGSRYKLGGVDQLQTGFVEIAEHYHNKTGKELSFYPLYVDKKGNKLVIGEKVTYNSNANPHEEKLRIANDLHQKLNDAARKGKSCK